MRCEKTALSLMR